MGGEGSVADPAYRTWARERHELESIGHDSSVACPGYRTRAREGHELESIGHDGSVPAYRTRARESCDGRGSAKPARAKNDWRLRVNPGNDPGPPVAKGSPSEAPLEMGPRVRPQEGTIVSGLAG
ncbi:hypothetical protein B0H17DRAFT_1179774 [Mycena rosella]|uniref:Uncharacterized protein n=1 Tax=Mycena rosella TaxID=1033263 RepID=A0AAD7DGS6_MYCRO|nr:hypothetical protein B0H17DRAFT_1179774 [Mycena rosella]